jgi:hypothetical protein
MRMRDGARASLLLAVALAGGACRSQPQPSADPAESQERLNVITNPSMYLDTSGFVFDEEASDHEQLLAMTVLNKSAFPVRGLEGDVIWLDDDGHPIGKSRFMLSGSVPPHGNKAFSIADGTMTSGTLTGGALRVGITFTRVNLGE